MKYLSFFVITFSFPYMVMAQAKTNEIFANGKVHFENIDKNGSFIQSKVFDDPKASKYKTGLVKPNGKSAVKTIFGVGRQDNRVDFVLLGDGYTRGELGQFQVDAEIVMGQFISEPPFNIYKNYLNFHRVDVVSNESGVDNDPLGVLKDTALDMEFNCHNTPRLLCADAQKVKQHAANAPAVDHMLVMANSTTYGGAGYWDDGIATLSARNNFAVELALHEVGHSFAQLGDEYSSFGTGRSSCLTRANASNRNKELMLERKLKWYRWFNLEHIGAFPGVCYSEVNSYRPTENSKMRTLGKPYDEINSEQIIFSIYKHVRPIDHATPEGTYSQGELLKVIPMRPVGHELSIQWYLDGKPLRGQTGEVLDTGKLKLIRARHSVSVTVVDNTDKVRDENQRALLMKDKRSWEIKKRFSR